MLSIVRFAVLVAVSAVTGHLWAVNQSYCSLKIVLIAPKIEIPEVPIVVEAPTGRIYKKPYQSGGVEFCDLGIAPVTIRVEGGCSRASLSDVELTWGAQRVVSIIYTPCRRGEPPPGNSCQVLLMIRDSKGHPIDSADVAMVHPMVASYTADKYGRVLIGLGFGRELATTIAKPGFVSRSFNWTCRPAVSSAEYDVVLSEIR